ncbi:MAG: hypothetical protein RLZZ326_574 [Planctomycetota bacterium]
MTTSGTINGVAAGTGVISTGTSTTTTLTNAGTIVASSRGVLNLATGSFGTVTNSGTVSGADWGLILQTTTGTVTNLAGGSISGNNGAGIASSAGLTLLDNAGSITSGNRGTWISGGTATTITNSSSISGGYSGLESVAGSVIGTVLNTGTVTGGAYGAVLATTGTVTNAAGALITGTANEGVLLLGGQTLSLLDNAGTINAGGSAVYSAPDATIGTLMNTGTVTGGAHGVVLGTTGTVTNAVGALINGSANEGVYLHGGQTLMLLDNAGTINAAGTGVYGAPSSTFGTVTNSGTISGGNWGAELSTTGTVTNSAGAVIHGGGNGGLNTNGSVQLIDSAGLIDGGNFGLYTYYGPVTTLTNSGTIQGSGYGAMLNMTTGTIANSGTIKGNTTALYVLSMSTVDTLTNTATGRIEGSSQTWLVVSGTVTSVVNDGLISASPGSGLAHYGTTGTITNNGTITGYYGVYHDGTLTTFTNSASGLIQGSDVGFYADYTVDAIDNFGTITGNITAGVEFDTSFSNIGVLTNHAGALIESAGGDGVLVGTYGNDFAADTVSNAGSIRGATSGVRVEDGKLLSLVNTGTIAYSGTGSGPAVRVGPSGILGDASGTKGPAIVSTAAGALLAGGIINSGTINQGFLIGNQNVSVGGGIGLGVFNGGTLNVVNGNLTFTDGTLQLKADVSVNGGTGLFLNSATLDLLANQTVTGNFQQSSSGTALVELLGLTPGSYGHLGVTGTADFAGALALNDSQLSGGIAPGETFNLFSFASYTGGFSALFMNGLALASLGTGAWAYGGLILTEIWTGTTMSLSVTGTSAVPEIDPASAGSVVTLVGGVLALLERRLRRRGRAPLQAG